MWQIMSENIGDEGSLGQYVLPYAIKLRIYKQLLDSEKELEVLKGSSLLFPKHKYDELLHELLGFIDGLKKAVEITTEEIEGVKYVT
jgi:hypothetical protein